MKLRGGGSSAASRKTQRLNRLLRISEALPEIEVTGRQHRAFRVRQKPFAYYLDDHHGDGIVSLCCKTSFDEQCNLVESEPDGGAGGGVHARRRPTRREDREAQPALTRAGWVGQRAQKGLQSVDVVREAAAAQEEGLVGIVSDDRRIDLGRGFDTFGERLPGDLVVP